MIYNKTDLQDAYLIELEPRADDRGVFARTMCREEFEKNGLVGTYVQQNFSASALKGTIRGLHYQNSPHQEAKLVRCTKGHIVDVIVDLRKDSETFLQHQAFELSDANRLQLYVPPGFAHGFQTLTDDVEVTYLVSANYAPGSEAGLRCSDPALGITWPVEVTTLSPKDADWPLIESGSWNAPF